MSAPIKAEQVETAGRALYDHWRETENRDVGEWDDEDFDTGYPRREAWREQARVAFRAAGFEVATRVEPILSNQEIAKRVAEGQPGDGYDYARQPKVRS